MVAYLRSATRWCFLQLITMASVEVLQLWIEASDADVLHGQTEVRDVGSVAARRGDEFDWTAFQSCIVFDLSALGSVWRDPATCPQKVAICAELNGAGGDISRVDFRAVPAVNRQKPEPFGFNDKPRGSQNWWASGLSRDAHG
jgi:hypothetical protein